MSVVKYVCSERYGLTASRHRNLCNARFPWEGRFLKAITLFVCVWMSLSGYSDPL